jgi:membrane-associated phospholipid phosphatase
MNRTSNRVPVQNQPTVNDAIPATWDGRLAYAISQVGSPPVLAIAAFTLTAATASTPGAWAWAGLYAVLAILPPLIYLVWLLHRGQVADLDVQLREERTRPMVFAIACAGIAVLALLMGTAPLEMTLLAAALWVQSVAIFGITLRWKISVHSATAAAAATLMWFLTGALLPLLVGVPVIAWSRVRLRRHTVAQTVAGALLGLAILVATFSLTC